MAWEAPASRTTPASFNCLALTRSSLRAGTPGRGAEVWSRGREGGQGLRMRSQVLSCLGFSGRLGLQDMGV